MSDSHILYMDMDGNKQRVDPSEFEWLEDGPYLAKHEERCSRYYIGERDGDSASIWVVPYTGELDLDYVEVDPDDDSGDEEE